MIFKIASRPPVVYGAAYCVLIGLFSALFYFFGEFEIGDSCGPVGIVDLLYLSTVTITTLGYGDITPINNTGKFLTAIEAVLGIFTIGLFLNSIASRLSTIITSYRDETNNLIKNHLNYSILQVVERYVRKVIDNAMTDGVKQYVYFDEEMLISRNCKDISLDLEPPIVEVVEVEITGDTDKLTSEYIGNIMALQAELEGITGGHSERINDDVLRHALKLTNVCKDFLEYNPKSIATGESIEDYLKSFHLSLFRVKDKLIETQQALLSKATLIESREEYHKKIKDKLDDLK